MGNSPVDSKKKGKADSPPSLPLPEPIEAPAPAAAVKPEPAANEEKSIPLAPPPRPLQPALNVSDYFSNTGHSIAPLAPPHLAYEPNPFEHSFAGGGAPETPGGTKLPSVAALTSPAPLLPGGGTTPYTWTGSLRTGPLSPAMLSGPTNDYFGDSHLRGGFPTPNESSLRTGLTPGGGGSMFPAASPNSSAFLGLSGHSAPTPGALDFHRSALTASALNKRNDAPLPPSITSQPQDMMNGMDKTLRNQSNQEVFDQHHANDAANGLYMLASSARTTDQPGQYAAAQPQTVHAHPHPPPSSNMMSAQSAEISPTMANRNHTGSLSTASGRGVSEASEESEQKNRPNTRGRGKKGAAAQANGRRKPEETPSKAPASKKSKGNNGNANVSAMSLMEPEPPSEEEPDMSKDEYNANGKKMTDEEKRKNFLERNRVAALKCRQRKKQWLANLQQKVEMYSSENDALSAQITALRDEVVNLKTLLLAHKDCPVTQQQGLGGMHMQLMGEYANQMQNPYGMVGMNSQQIMAGQGQRRYS